MGNALKRILAGCLRGDEQAVRALVEQYQGMVFSLCLRLLGNRQDAEDVVQETFIRVVRSLASYDRSRRFEPWLLAIAANRCRTLLAAQSRRREVVIPWEHIAAKPSHGLEEEHLREELTQALETLRPEHRQAFVMFHQMEMSYAQIAEVLDCPINTVKTWIHRARRQLVAHLQARRVLESSAGATS